MGFASYREDDLFRFLDATTNVPDPSEALPQRYRCPFCAESFEDRHTLSAHLSARHRGDRPVLMIAGREPDRVSTIRQPLPTSEIVLENCTVVRARLNGYTQDGIETDAVSTLLARETDAEIDLDLINQFDDVATPVTQSYRLLLRMPAKASLDMVDRAFIEHLATSKPEMSQVSAFLQDSRCSGVVSDYANALGAYVRGLLVKDQAVETGVTLPPSEADGLYGEALDTLKDFRRPLPVVICGLVRFAFNDFGFADRPTGFRRLDRCNASLTVLLEIYAAGSCNARQEPISPATRLCPFDHAVDRVLDLAERLQRQSRWGPALTEECRSTAQSWSLTARDRVKVLALWADTTLRLGAVDAALEPLRQLRSTYPFCDWATQQLDRLEG